VDLYIAFEKKLLNEWKAPLLNDLFAMMAFGRLQKKCAALGLDKENPNIHNDLLCGSSDIISVEPIHRTIEIASRIINDKSANDLFVSKQEEAIWSEIMKGAFPDLKTQITQYIHDFGERCIGELKLETISYAQKPELFIKVLKTYVERGISKTSLTGNTELNLRRAAEELAFSKLRFRPLIKWLFKRSLRNTRLLVSNRENLRYERTRAFGIVRELFSHIGNKFAENSLIVEKRDIFYLSKEEIIGFVKGTAISTSLKDTIALRKAEFENYRNTPAPSERFATYGTVFIDNDFYATDKLNEYDGKLQGVGCCPGKLKGKVRVVRNPEELSSLEGDILVTTSTDPGWVVLFPTAAAILVERGSLLSHSAIVSREMGIPCIVGISGLLQKLKTGDLIEMNGSTGEVFLLNENT
jgi:rifampicin phosphotransferase